jgi:S1-C subfamily serine protease
VRFLPDWLIYILAIAAIVAVLFAIDRRSDAPQALPGQETQAGAFLPPASLYDPQVLVEVGAVASGLGTAVAISEDGWWLTARHLVDSCESVGIIVSRMAAAPAREVRAAEFADLALIRTDFAPTSLAIDTTGRQMQIGENAFHIGFPQGRPGESMTRLVSREILVVRGRYEFQEPVLVWSEVGRTGGMGGSLSGISGGPALAANGQIIGITIAESTRRGRLYTAAPSTIASFLDVENVSPRGTPSPRLRDDNYGQEADLLRRALAVAQVVCVAPEDLAE